MNVRPVTISAAHRTGIHTGVSRVSLAGLIVMSTFGLLALLAPFLAPTAPNTLSAPLQPPGSAHRLGTDDIGRDILTQLLYGARTSLFIAALSTLLSSLLGLLVGLIAGVFDRLGFVLLRVADVFLAIPRFPLIILMAAFLRPGLPTLVLFFVIFGWPRAARMVRAQVLSERHRAYIGAAKALGASHTRIIVRHLMPGTLPILTAFAVMEVQHVILAESGLSFLGLGDPTIRSWGLLLSNAFRFPTTFITDQWVWWALPPGLCITLVILALTAVSFALLDNAAFVS